MAVHHVSLDRRFESVHSHFLVEYASGQRNLTVNQTAKPSGVRIPPLPLANRSMAMPDLLVTEVTASVTFFSRADVAKW